MKTAKMPDKNAAGSISPDRPQRSATVKTANPNADPKAAKFPKNAAPPWVLSCTIIPIPAIANNIASQVAFLTFSRKKIQPSIAAMKGAEANKSIAFATEVDCIP